MLSRKLGGTQQAFLDYDKAMTLEGHKVINIISSNASINDVMKPDHKLPNIFPACPISKAYLRFLVARYQPSIIITHGDRETNFAAFLKAKKIPLVGVAHSYIYKKLRYCDYIIAITDDIKSYLIANGAKQDNIVKVSNMLSVELDYHPRKFKSPIVIGSFGRFVKNKGFEYLIKSLPFLKEQGHNFKLLLGGSGKEEENLKRLVHDLNLEKEVEFTGWVSNKDEFFDKIDIFCLSSTIEPFGIILLEAMEHSVPIVSTNCQGPAEVLRDGIDALLVNTKSPEELADNLSSLILHPEKASALSKAAYDRLKNNYNLTIQAKNLSNILNKITSTDIEAE